MVLAISIDRGKDEAVRRLVKRYVIRKNLTFLNLLDPTSKAAAEYCVRGVPGTFFIDPQGQVVALANGFRDLKKKEGLMMFDQLLAGKTQTGD